MDTLTRINRFMTSRCRDVLKVIFLDQDLSEADLTDFMHGIAWPQTLLPLVRDVVGANTALTCIILEKNFFDDSCLFEVCCIIRMCKRTLTSLSLAFNQLVDVTTLAAQLMGSTVSDDDREIFGMMRERPTSLTHLDLRCNTLTLASAHALSVMLRRPTGLLELDVSCNTWGRAGASLIVGALSLNSGLQRIRVHGKGVPEEYQEKAEAIMSNRRVE